MYEIIAGSIFVLSAVDALYCICIHKNTWCDCISCFDQHVAFTICSNVNITKQQGKLKNEQEWFKRSFQPSWQSKGSDVLGDWPRENNKKVNFSFTCCQLPFFPTEQPSKILPGKYVTWHTCLADDLEKKPKLIWIPAFRNISIMRWQLQLTCFWCEDLASCFWFLLFSSWLSLKILYKMSVN